LCIFTNIVFTKRVAKFLVWKRNCGEIFQANQATTIFLCACFHYFIFDSFLIRMGLVFETNVQYIWDSKVQIRLFLIVEDTFWVFSNTWFENFDVVEDVIFEFARVFLARKFFLFLCSIELAFCEWRRSWLYNDVLI
jgi:hypothetical protein